MKPYILLLLAHPDFENSTANKAMVDAVKDLDNVTVVDVAKTPAKTENYHDLVKKADVIVMQFPVWWASAPSCLKEWIDVCMMPFMDNPGLTGKRLMVACTTGSPYETYRAGGSNHFTIDELLRPYEMTANYSGMTYMTPFTVYGTMTPAGAQNITDGARAYKALLSALQ